MKCVDMTVALMAIAPVIIGLLAVSALFSAGEETAMTGGASRGRMHQLERDGDRAALARVNRLIADQETMIGSVLLGNNLINILCSALVTVVLTKAIGRLGRGGSHRADDRAGPGVRRGAAQDPGHH